MSVEDKTIVITGASAGIGQELAVQLAGRGATLVLAGRNKDALEQTRGQCMKAGAKAIVVATDVTQVESCRNLIDQTIKQLGRLDVLVNNAGLSMVAPFETITDLTLFERIMAVNYLGSVYCTHFALPHLKKRRGLIVAVSSLQGKTGFPDSTAYAASKHAMQGFFDSLRIELDDSGVGVLVVSPGPVATRIHTHRLRGDGKLSADDSRSNEAGMPVAECARQMVVAIERRRRELVMTAAGKAGQWLKLIAPGLTDRLVARAVRRFYQEP